MKNYSITLPSYSIGDNVYSKIGEICEPYGKKVICIGGKTAISKVRDLIINECNGTSLEILDFLWYGGDATYENVNTLKENELVKKADIIFGIGDTYAKYFEAEMSSRGEDLVHYHALGVTTSQMCLTPLLKYGKKALDDFKSGTASFEVEQVVLGIVVTTGIASILLTNEHIIDYNTGLAHAVFYALTSYPHIEERHLHGEVVGYGVLILLLVDKNEEMFKKMFEFNRSINLPTCLADIEMNEDDLDKLVPMVCNMKDIDHNPYKISEDMVYKAFKKLEEYSKIN